MDAMLPNRSAVVVTTTCVGLLWLAVPPVSAMPTFNCPGVRFIGNTSVNVPDPQNTATSCTTAFEGGTVAADGTFNAITGFFLTGWTLTTNVFGQLLRVSNGAGITWNLGTLPGSLTSVGSPGQVTTYSYDAMGRIESTTAPGSQVTQYTYQGSSNLIHEATGPSGTITRYSYTADRPVTVQENPGTPGERQITYTYNSLSSGPETATESPVSPTDRVTRYTYDAGNGNRLTQKEEESAPPPPPDKPRTQYSYDSLNRLEKTEAAPSGNVTRYEYAGISDRVTKVTDDPPAPPVITEYHYNSDNRIVEIERNDVLITRFEYDAAGHLTGDIQNPGTPNETRTRFEYDTSGHLAGITFIDSRGQSTSTGPFNFVPVPGSLLLLSLGLGALALHRRGPRSGKMRRERSF